MDDVIRKKFFTIPQAAEYLNVSVSCMYKKTHRREIPFYKPGNKIIYLLQDDLDGYVLSSRQSTKDDIQCSVTEIVVRKGGQDGE